MKNLQSLQERKAEVLASYKAAKKTYFADRSNENWIVFFDAKVLCMQLDI